MTEDIIEPNTAALEQDIYGNFVTQDDVVSSSLDQDLHKRGIGRSL